MLQHSREKEREDKRRISETKGNPNAKFLFLLLFRSWPSEFSFNSMFFIKLVCLVKSNDKYKSLRSVSPYAESYSWEAQLSVVKKLWKPLICCQQQEAKIWAR
jgi:hypothetical protein